MLLAIDAGNTNVVFALVDGGTIVSRWRIATDPRRTADQYAVWLHQLLAMDGRTLADVEAVIIATVVPRALHNLQVLAQKYVGVEALIAGRAPVEWGIQLDVVEPATVGADRVVIAAIPPYERAPQAAATYDADLAAWAYSEGYPVVDPWTFARGADDLWAAGWSADGIHPTVSGYERLGREFHALILDATAPADAATAVPEAGRAPGSAPGSGSGASAG